MKEKIKCSKCRFATKDEKTSNKNWIAYECSNPNSEYQGSLLNVKPNGNMLTRITWSGCEYGKQKY